MTGRRLRKCPRRTLHDLKCYSHRGRTLSTLAWMSEPYDAGGVTRTSALSAAFHVNCTAPALQRAVSPSDGHGHPRPRKQTDTCVGPSRLWPETHISTPQAGSRPACDHPACSYYDMHARGIAAEPRPSPGQRRRTELELQISHTMRYQLQAVLRPKPSGQLCTYTAPYCLRVCSISCGLTPPRRGRRPGGIQWPAMTTDRHQGPGTLPLMWA